MFFLALFFIPYSYLIVCISYLLKQFKKKTTSDGKGSGREAVLYTAYENINCHNLKGQVGNLYKNLKCIYLMTL